MTDPVRLERLHVYLNRVMNDGEIIANPRLMPNGVKKVAAHMGVDVAEVPNLILELSQHLQSLTEGTNDEPRYTYEDDALGGVTVRDSDTGKEKYLNVQQANKLLKMLDSDAGTEQETLAKALNESFAYRAPELSADDIGSETSIFNFPWKLNESAGFAAAEYSGFGMNFRMNIVSVVDQNGDPVDNYDRKSLARIARAYIDEA
jgi:hypothetical protein